VSDKRLKFFASFCTIFAGVLILRLAHIQLNPNSAWQSQLEKIKVSRSTQLASLRAITRRNGKTWPENQGVLHGVLWMIKFSLLADERLWIARISLRYTIEEQRQKIKEKYQADFNS
jgi:cell division protein FtsI/penicillin-binding protein 2